MSKVVTLRLSDTEYKKISSVAADEHRPISNFITTLVMHDIEESCFVDSIEMSQIKSDKKLMAKLARGHGEVQKRRGRLLG